MHISFEKQAVLKNLPTLVSDMDVLDLIDHLTSSTPALLTTSDYESVLITCEKQGRSAGVRHFISCLLRRPFHQNGFQQFLNALSSDYEHLSMQLSKTYEELIGKNRNTSSSLSTKSLHGRQTDSSYCNQSSSQKCLPPCLLVRDDNLNNLQLLSHNFDHANLDILFSILSMICSHPLIVINSRQFLQQLGAIRSNEVSSSAHCCYSNPTEHSDSFHSSLLGLRRGLQSYLIDNLVRDLESRGSPQKFSSANKQNIQRSNAFLIEKLIKDSLIPALEKLNCWSLVERVLSELNCTNTADENNNNKNKNKKMLNNFHECHQMNAECALICSSSSTACYHHPVTNEFDSGQCRCDGSKLQTLLVSAGSILLVCIQPLLNHSLISMDWPFLMRHLHICPVCILYFFTNQSEPSPPPPPHSDTNNNGVATFDWTNPKSNWIQPIPDVKIGEQKSTVQANLIRCFTILLRQVMCEKFRTSQIPGSDEHLDADLHRSELEDLGVSKCAVASFIHRQLVPALRTLQLNALCDEIEQLASQNLH